MRAIELNPGSTDFSPITEVINGLNRKADSDDEPWDQFRHLKLRKDKKLEQKRGHVRQLRETQAKKQLYDCEIERLMREQDRDVLKQWVFANTLDSESDSEQFQ